MADRVSTVESARVAGRSLTRVLALVAPVLLAVAFVLLDFVANAVPLSALWRPMAISVGVAVLVTAGAARAAGPVRGGVIAFVIVGVFAGMFVLAGAVLLSLAIFGAVRSRPGREYTMAAALAGVVALALVVAAVVSGVRQEAFDWSPLEVEAVDLGDARPGPSIHLLLLDGYPRADVLGSLGIDNAPFLAGLEQRGFDVYDDSTSNYDRTPFSIMTLLSMRHLEDIGPLWSEPMPQGLAEEERRAARALLDLPTFEALGRIGYATAINTGPVVHVPLGAADRQRDAGTATNFELDLLQRTPMAGVLEIFGFATAQQRAQITTTLEHFADPPLGPSFTFTHVMAPHPPFVFGPEGASADAPPCYPASCSIFESDVARLGWSEDEHWSRLAEHMATLDDLVLDAVDRLAQHDPDAVVVIFSDHGVRADGEPGELNRNLLVAHTPGHPELFGTSPTLINVLPKILNAYLGTNVAEQENTRFAAGVDPWLSLQPLDP